MTSSSSPISISSLRAAAEERDLSVTACNTVSLEFSGESQIVRVYPVPTTKNHVETAFESLPRFLQQNGRTAIFPGSTDIIIAHRDEGTLQTYQKSVEEGRSAAATIELVQALESSDVLNEVDETPSSTLYSVLSKAYLSKSISEEHLHSGELDVFTGHSTEGKGFYSTIISWLLADDPETVTDISGNRSGFLATATDYKTESDTQFTALTADEDEPGLTECLAALEYPAYLDADTDVRSFASFAADLAENTEESHSESSPLQDVILGNLLVAPFRPKDVGQETRDNIHQVSDSPPDLNLRIGGAIAGLKTGGRGALILPRSNLTNARNAFDVMGDKTEIHAILDLDTDLLGIPSIHSSFEVSMVLFTRSDSVDADHTVRHITVDEYHDKLGDLIRVPGKRVMQTSLENRPLHVQLVSQRDLIECPAPVLLQDAKYAPLFRSEKFIRLGEKIEVYWDLKMVERESLYFSESELEKSQIKRKFVTPVIRWEDIDEDEIVITDDDLSHSILDPQPILNAAGIEDTNPSTHEVVAGLQTAGHQAAADYIEQHSGSFTKLLVHSRLNLTDRKTPDFVLPRLSPDTKWRRTKVSKAVIDDRCLGMNASDETTATALHRILNTAGYQDFTKLFFDSIGAGGVRYLRYRIDQIPVPKKALTKEFVEETDAYFPPQSRQDQISLIDALTATTAAASEKTVRTFEQFFKADDEFAWAWFLSLEEYDTFQSLWLEDEQAAKSFVIERLEEGEVTAVSESLSGGELSEYRTEVIREGIEEYLNGRYRLFLYTIIPQFEGVIADWAKKEGNKITEEDNSTIVVLKDEKGSVGKSLTSMIEHFIGGGFGEFLTNNIRDLRNEVTHGEVVVNDRQQAAICLLSLNALCQRTLVN